jgi:glutamine phosphoribosylpyrophosphate amidotransferase
MCGILGVSFKQKDIESIEFVKRLMFELKIRGIHSFGIAFQDTEFHRLVYNEVFIDHMINEFMKSPSMSFIFHNRYSTSGDYHIEKGVLDNNQPIVVSNIGALAMNGVISQATKPEYEQKYGVKCTSDNDTEIFLRKMEQGISIPDIVKQNPDCSFAGVYIKRRDNTIYGYRNNKRPLYKGQYKNCSYIVSTLDTIRRAGGDLSQVSIVPIFTEVTI